MTGKPTLTVIMLVEVAFRHKNNIYSLKEVNKADFVSLVFCNTSANDVCRSSDQSTVSCNVMSG